MNLHIDVSDDSGILASLNRDVQEIHTELFPELFKPFDLDSVRSQMDSFLQEDGARALVAYDGKEPIGYALTIERMKVETPYRYGYRYLMIDQMSIRPQYRRQGIATALINRIKELAIQNDIDRIELTVWTENRDAAAFYDKLGFTPTVERRELSVGDGSDRHD